VQSTYNPQDRRQRVVAGGGGRHLLGSFYVRQGCYDYTGHGKRPAGQVAVRVGERVAVAKAWGLRQITCELFQAWTSAGRLEAF
jgi:hypothetical protein